MMTQPHLRFRLKSRLVPIWNTACHCLRTIDGYADAIVHARIERCTACGRFRPMMYHRKIIPRRLAEVWNLTPRLCESFARKESCFCSRCGANLRARRLAQAFVALYPVGSPPVPARSLAEWIQHPDYRRLRIAEINKIDGLHEQLVRLPNFSSSDYRPDASPGSIVDGVRSEDLTCLTYPDSSFDLVLTSETLEHVPDLDAALREIRRVLTPGGWHVFTIPQLPHMSKTFARSIVIADGSIHDHAPTIFHPAGDAGYRVYTEFGRDIEQVLATAGFEVEVLFGPNRDDDVAQVYACRKPQE